MSESTRRARRGPLVLLALVLVVAVCAMHQLGGGHAGMTMGAGTSSFMPPSTVPAAMVGHPAHDGATSRAVTGDDPSTGGTSLAGRGEALLALAPGSPDVPALPTPVCLAVLLLGASALLALRTPSRRGTPARHGSTTVVRRRVGRVPSRDLLAELCVMRT